MSDEIKLKINVGLFENNNVKDVFNNRCHKKKIEKARFTVIICSDYKNIKLLKTPFAVKSWSIYLIIGRSRGAIVFLIVVISAELRSREC